MSTIKRYTIKRSDTDKFFWPMPFGATWSSEPDIANAYEDKDECAGVKFRVSRKYDFPVEVCEVTISWE